MAPPPSSKPKTQMRRMVFGDKAVYRASKSPIKPALAAMLRIIYRMIDPEILTNAPPAIEVAIKMPLLGRIKQSAAKIRAKIAAASPPITQSNWIENKVITPYTRPPPIYNPPQMLMMSKEAASFQMASAKRMTEATPIATATGMEVKLNPNALHTTMARPLPSMIPKNAPKSLGFPLPSRAVKMPKQAMSTQAPSKIIFIPEHTPFLHFYYIIKNHFIFLHIL